MTARPFRIELLEAHERAGFDCGTEALNEYFRQRATQDARRHVSFCYVAVETARAAIAGFYTLAAASIPLADLPTALSKKLPRYPVIPAVRIGRLAIDRRYQGRKLGSALLFDAIARTCKSGIAAYAVVVDAKDERAVAFYEHHGFERFANLERTLFLPVSEALKDLTRRGD